MNHRRDFAAGVASAVLVIAIWALFIVLSRASVRQDVTMWDLAFLRFTFAALSVLPFFLARPPGRRLGTLTPMRAAVLAAFAGLGFTLFAFKAFSLAPASHGAVLMSGTLPFSTALIAWAVLGERVTRRKALGLAAILVGVVMMAMQSFRQTGGPTWAGDALFPLASGSWAVFAVLSRKWRVAPVDATLAIPLFACVAYVPAYVLLAPIGLGAMGMVSMISLGLFQGVLALVVSMWAFSRVLASFGPVRTSMITSLAPPVAAVGAVFLLDEALTPLVLVGLVAVTVGMIVGVGGASPAPQPSVK